MAGIINNNAAIISGSNQQATGPFRGVTCVVGGTLSGSLYPDGGNFLIATTTNLRLDVAIQNVTGTGVYFLHTFPVIS